MFVVSASLYVAKIIRRKRERSVILMTTVLKKRGKAAQIPYLIFRFQWSIELISAYAKLLVGFDRFVNGLLAVNAGIALDGGLMRAGREALGVLAQR